MGINIKDQLAFYSAYHRNPVNQWIHIVCVPLIFWTSMVFFSELMVGGISASWFVGLAYGLFYLVLDPVVGAVLSALLYVAVVTALDFSEVMPNPYQIAITIHCVAWLAQFYGHGVHECRAPSLFTSFFQSLFMAPFFVSMELLFKAGFKKELQLDIDRMVGDVLLKADAGKKQK